MMLQILYTPLHSHMMCRFIPTCSEYMKIAIERFGVFKGIYLGTKRILRCHPHGKSGIDMVICLIQYLQPKLEMHF